MPHPHPTPRAGDIFATPARRASRVNPRSPPTVSARRPLLWSMPRSGATLNWEEYFDLCRQKGIEDVDQGSHAALERPPVTAAQLLAAATAAVAAEQV